MKADRILSTGLDLDKLGILESVRVGLAPFTSRVHANLDKLNLYGRRGVRDYVAVEMLLRPRVVPVTRS